MPEFPVALPRTMTDPLKNKNPMARVFYGTIRTAGSSPFRSARSAVFLKAVSCECLRLNNVISGHQLQQFLWVGIVGADNPKKNRTKSLSLRDFE
jgi:hypothetical protein